MKSFLAACVVALGISAVTFLLGCLRASRGAGGLKPRRRKLIELFIERWQRRPAWVTPVIGTELSVAAAALLCLFCGNSAFKSWLPLCFLVIVPSIAMRFGVWAGISGTLLSAGIFALALFEPFQSLRVHDLDERNHLVWMVLIGIGLSELCGQIKPKIDSAG